MNRGTTASRAAGFIVAGAACFVGLASFGSIGACGGRVDGVTGSSGSSGGSGTSGGAADTPGPKPPGTGRPGGRPPAGPMSNAAVASAIAEDYCKAFSSCCVGAGQPPIDVARCRALTSAGAAKQLDAAGATESSPADVAVCVGAIHTRIAACAKDDIRWHDADPPIFAPATVATACQPLLPNVMIPPFERCSESMSCRDNPAICAIDVCSTSRLLGTGCSDTAACFDSGNCIDGECLAASLAGVGASCATEVDCRVGLVCFQRACAPTRDHPELAKQRSSPYRIGADTCSAYSYQ